MQVYGLTELCGVITHLLPEAHHDAEHPERLLSAGTVLPSAECRVVDPATLEDVPVGEPGELWFKTPQLMKGYLGKPEETAKVITEDGWFRTGDIGQVDAGGYVYVEDRLKDMIISGGENIYSPEVERVLSEHPAVAEVAVIGVPDDRWGEVVKAVVGLKPGRLGHRGGDHRVHRRAARAVQVPPLGRHRAGTPPQPDRQDPQEGPAQPYWEGRDRSVV